MGVSARTAEGAVAGAAGRSGEGAAKPGWAAVAHRVTAMEVVRREARRDLRTVVEWNTDELQMWEV
ncbi:hypothetical protein GCM10010218_56490 [Streptomyces mashuensis]|uniref:Uncharacterized protein n=1 Tax=Streptomyces mashuensis TaxID=33904 RepID=A0A919B8R2_9ACTN|nr:hypothetical protein GCM10010218_56490 [Streptomyces mashuensis]